MHLLAKAAIAGCLMLGANSALADDGQVVITQATLDQFWMLIAAALVFMMQAGFMLLEAGQVRSKNAINVAQKNLMDFIFSSLLFGAFGASIMFGTSHFGLFGWNSEMLLFGTSGSWTHAMLIFQLMFAGTAATILSGAVAERMSLTSYLTCVAMISVLIYPIVGHWVWGNVFTGDTTPLLVSWGFMDFAGGTVVHGVGAWVALAAIIEIGPRRGKFTSEGKARALQGHSPVMAGAGCILLWFGWLGFNAGAISPTNDLMPIVMLNTLVAGACGGVVMMCIGRAERGVYRPEASINGVLGGLVAITPCCNVVDPAAAILIGLSASIVVYGGTMFLERGLQLDDPLGAIPVHGFAGVWGTLMTGVFAHSEDLVAGSRTEQIIVQLAGAGLVFVFVFSTAFIVIRGLGFILGPNPEGRSGLRVPEQAEVDGLNVAEHGATMGMATMQDVLARFAESPHAIFHQVDLEPDDDAYEMSLHFNEIITRMDSERDMQRQRHKEDIAQRDRITDDITRVISAAADGDFSQRLSLEDKQGFLRTLSSKINDLCGVTSGTLDDVRRVLSAAAQGDFDARIEGSYTGTLADIQNDVNGTLHQLGSAISAVEDLVDQAAAGNFSERIAMTDQSGAIAELCEGVNRICDVSERGLTDLTERLKRMAEGDMTITKGEGHEGQFQDIMQALEDTSRHIATLIHGISSGSDEVRHVGRAVSDTAEAIESASSTQSETLSALCETLGQIEHTTRQHASRTQEARSTCDVAYGKATEGTALATDAVAKMTQIAEAADDIAGTVDLIQGIARQTHLLSINASVEAASSSGNNAGFRIVAEEVRALASETNEAANRITEKAELVGRIVAEQEVLVSDISEKLGEVRSAFADTSAVVMDLATSSQAEAQRLTETTNSLASLQDSALQNAKLSIGNKRNVVELQESLERTAGYVAKFEIPENLSGLASAA